MPVSRKRPGHRRLVEDRARRRQEAVARGRAALGWTARDFANERKRTQRFLDRWYSNPLEQQRRADEAIEDYQMSDPNQGRPETPQPGQPGQVQAGTPSPHLQQAGQPAQPQPEQPQPGQPQPPQPGPAPQPAAGGQPGQTQHHPELRRGSQGDAVRELQGRLQVPWLKQDGDFGEATEQAVKAYQQSQGLAADGVVGPETWAKLDHVVGGVQQAQHT